MRYTITIRKSCHRVVINKKQEVALKGRGADQTRGFGGGPISEKMLDGTLGEA